MIRRYLQIGHIVRDAEQAARAHAATFGSGPFALFRARQGQYRFRGDIIDCRFSVALGYYGDTEIEFLQPEAGRSIYAEVIDAGQEGFHHLCYATPDLPRVMASLEEQGYRPCWAPPAERPQWFVYMEKPSSNEPVIELVTPTIELQAAQAKIRAWSKDWDESRPIREYENFAALAASHES